MNFNRNKPGPERLPFCFLLVAGLLSGCAGMGKPPEETVSERAQARWDALLSDQVEVAYGYLSPGYRSGLSLRDYERKLLMQQVRWTGARIISSNCSENACKAKISIDYTAIGAVPGVRAIENKRSIEEDWVKVDESWYYLPKN